MCKRKTGRLPGLPLILASSSGVVLVRRNRSWDVAKVKKVCWVSEASQKFTQKRVKPSGEFMHAMKDCHDCWGVCKAVKRREERLTHGGSPLTLLLTAHL